MGAKNQRVALISGGMGGIGTAICHALADESMQVITTYHKGGDHQQALKWQSQQEQLGYCIEPVFVDVSDANACQNMIKDVLARYSKVDVLVNNAGITRDHVCAKMSIDDWQEVIAVNLNSVFYLTQPILQSMMMHSFGRIINISSINAQKGQRGQTNYSAAKAGMHGFTKALAQEVADKHITVNTISPGYINTPMVMQVREDIREAIISDIPVGRLGEPWEVARVVTFLAAEESAFITGANIAINGGQYLF